MALLGELAVRLVGHTKDFDKKMSKSKRHITGIEKASKTANRALSALGLTFGSFAVAGFVNDQRRLIDEIGKGARRLALSTEAYGAYRHAAQLSGLSTQELTNALEKMRDTLGAAVGGEQFAARPFERLGLDVETLTQLEDPLGRIQDAMEGIADANQRTAIARDIFGRGGGRILNLFENDLRGLRKEYEELGLAVSGEEAKRVEEFNDQLTIMAERLKGTGRSLFIDATPRLLEALQGVNVLADLLQQPTKGSQRAPTPGLPESVFGGAGVAAPGALGGVGFSDQTVRILGEVIAGLATRPANAPTRAIAGAGPAGVVSLSPDTLQELSQRLTSAFGADRQVFD